MPELTPKFKAAAVHSAPIYMDKAKTLKKVISWIEKARTESVELLVFPEVFVPGFPYFINPYPPKQQVGAIIEYGKQSVVVGDDGGDLKEVMAACRKNRLAISLGISERMAGGHTLFNAQVMIDSNGQILGVHRKLQPTFAERYVWAQGSGHTLRAYETQAGYRIGGLACWEHTLNGARQALIQDRQQIHAAAWPALSTIEGFQSVADIQIEAMMKNHAITAQVFVICASNYVDQSCLDWLTENVGPLKEGSLGLGGGYSAIYHPFCAAVAGPKVGDGEELVIADIDLAQIGFVKVWVDGAGHYSRPEILKFEMDRRPVWPDDVVTARSHLRSAPHGDASQAGAEGI
ncbi:hypothetical protein BP5796_06499 [Coleophoma crateriformis]|uniref:CN hydrolase domain-containing protein n=1 Tax=Coleophoma crateriformis TaxID=565419 RepID=A0A3D8RNZ8_9HELO|nr:hypothetical protein BP5796_06499 [Coleophoma crateriformis]